MAIYQTRWFDRWAKKQHLGVNVLCLAVREIAAGLYDADLGGGLIKKRIARAGRGKKRWISYAVGNQQGKPVDFCVWLSEKRA